MKGIARLIRAYERRGYGIRIGLNPGHFGGKWNVPYGSIYADDQQRVPTGSSLSLVESHLLRDLATCWQPKRILGIGNAFGWSTLLLAFVFPEARVVAIDDLTEGTGAREGFDLTQQLIEDLTIDNVQVREGQSPGDVADIVTETLGGLDLVLVDGLHTDPQQWSDYQAVRPHLAPDSVVLFHDVIDWGMMSSFEQISADWPGGSALLHRTPSGMGMLFSASLAEALKPLLTVYVERNLRRFDPEPIQTRPQIRRPRRVKKAMKRLRSVIAG